MVEMGVCWAAHVLRINLWFLLRRRPSSDPRSCVLPVLLTAVTVAEVSHLLVKLFCTLTLSPGENSVTVSGFCCFSTSLLLMFFSGRKVPPSGSQSCTILFIMHCFAGSCDAPSTCFTMGSVSLIFLPINISLGLG